MTRQELSNLVCAELPRLTKRDAAYAPQTMLAQWAYELTDMFDTPVVVTLVPAADGALGIVAYPLLAPKGKGFVFARTTDVSSKEPGDG